MKRMVFLHKAATQNTTTQPAEEGGVVAGGHGTSGRDEPHATKETGVAGNAGGKGQMHPEQRHADVIPANVDRRAVDCGGKEVM